MTHGANTTVCPSRRLNVFKPQRSWCIAVSPSSSRHWVLPFSVFLSAGANLQFRCPNTHAASCTHWWRLRTQERRPTPRKESSWMFRLDVSHVLKIRAIVKTLQLEGTSMSRKKCGEPKHNDNAKRRQCLENIPLLSTISLLRADNTCPNLLCTKDQRPQPNLVCQHVPACVSSFDSYVWKSNR